MRLLWRTCAKPIPTSTETQKHLRSAKPKQQPRSFSHTLNTSQLAQPNHQMKLNKHQRNRQSLEKEPHGPDPNLDVMDGQSGCSVSLNPPHTYKVGEVGSGVGWRKLSKRTGLTKVQMLVKGGYYDNGTGSNLFGDWPQEKWNIKLFLRIFNLLEAFKSSVVMFLFTIQHC